MGEWVSGRVGGRMGGWLCVCVYMCCRLVPKEACQVQLMSSVYLAKSCDARNSLGFQGFPIPSLKKCSGGLGF